MTLKNELERQDFFYLSHGMFKKQFLTSHKICDARREPTLPKKAQAPTPTETYFIMVK